VDIISLESVEKSFTVRHKAGRVRRRRSEVRAVDDVSFSITAGSTVGYIGPNGGCRMVQLVAGMDRRAGRGSASCSPMVFGRPRVFRTAG
jgi:ABC-type glutathione transport system ATPase component